ncbi:MAG TPA: ACT domain-containing protein [Acidiferrobacterales bacterium]|nr:ACT domain-containing protein [Acidiferrobacterales bacterium]
MAGLTKRNEQWHMLTVVGADRPAIVAKLTEALFRGGCNLGEASMARLGGNFCMMLMVEGADAAALEKLVRPVTDALGLRLHLDPIHGELHRHVEPNVQVTVYGADRPGIVAQATTALAAAGFNILDLNTDVAGTAERPIYIMLIDGYVAEGVVAVERAIAPLRADGIEVSVTALDTMIG